MLNLITKIMNRVTRIIVIVLVFISSGCSKLQNLGTAPEKEPEITHVEMEYNGVYMEEDNPERISSKFILRNHSFSFYIRTSLYQRPISLKMLISSGEEFMVNKWYSLPSEETDYVWESFAKLLYDRALPQCKDIIALAGRVMFTNFEQKGDLDYWGEGYCSIEGIFEITLENKEEPGKTNEIKNGKFCISKSRFWDTRALED